MRNAMCKLVSLKGETGRYDRMVKAACGKQAAPPAPPAFPGSDEGGDGGGGGGGGKPSDWGDTIKTVAIMGVAAAAIIYVGGPLMSRMSGGSTATA